MLRVRVSRGDTRNFSLIKSFVPPSPIRPSLVRVPLGPGTRTRPIAPPNSPPPHTRFPVLYVIRTLSPPRAISNRRLYVYNKRTARTPIPCTHIITCVPGNVYSATSLPPPRVTYIYLHKTLVVRTHACVFLFFFTFSTPGRCKSRLYPARIVEKTGRRDTKSVRNERGIKNAAIRVRRPFVVDRSDLDFRKTPNVRTFLDSQYRAALLLCPNIGVLRSSE